MPGLGAKLNHDLAGPSLRRCSHSPPIALMTKSVDLPVEALKVGTGLRERAVIGCPEKVLVHSLDANLVEELEVVIEVGR